jgi:nucleoside-diphosphate-sugar epimerase
MSSPLPKRILVFGATGVIGKYIIREIVNGRSSFEKIGLFTSPLTAETKSSELDVWRGAGVEVIVGDVTSEADIKEVYEGA